MKGFGIASIPSCGQIRTTEVPLQTTSPSWRVSSVNLYWSSGSEKQRSTVKMAAWGKETKFQQVQKALTELCEFCDENDSGEGKELYTDNRLLTTHVFNGTIKHKVQKRVKSFQDTTCYWSPHMKQRWETKIRYTATQNCLKSRFTSPVLFPPSIKVIRQTRPLPWNSALFSKVPMQGHPVCVVKWNSQGGLNHCFKMHFKTPFVCAEEFTE